MKTCLIVEDSNVVREIAVRILTDLAIEAKEVETAIEALAACGEKKPDVVLLDWDLPQLGALDFLRGVAALEPEKRPTIILCATENDPQQFTLAKAAGAAHYLLKPFDRQSIEAKLIEIGVVEGMPPTEIRAAQAS
jgi:two-component system chemotaxis response regulator CheY